MAKKRIPTDPVEVLALLKKIAGAIPLDNKYPTTGAPTQNDVQTRDAFLAQALANLDAAETALKTLRSIVHDERDKSVEVIVKVDIATDFAHGPGGVAKNNYGLPPKKKGGSSIPLEQCLIKKVKDGKQPRSLHLNWGTIEGAVSYEVEWFLDANLTQRVDKDSTSLSEMQIEGLTKGTQYWIRVRAVRGKEKGVWADPATRVANA